MGWATYKVTPFSHRGKEIWKEQDHWFYPIRALEGAWVAAALGEPTSRTGWLEKKTWEESFGIESACQGDHRVSEETKEVKGKEA